MFNSSNFLPSQGWELFLPLSDFRIYIWFKKKPQLRNDAAVSVFALQYKGHQFKLLSVSSLYVLFNSSSV